MLHSLWCRQRAEPAVETRGVCSASRGCGSVQPSQSRPTDEDVDGNVDGLVFTDRVGSVSCLPDELELSTRGLTGLPSGSPGGWLGSGRSETSGDRGSQSRHVASSNVYHRVARTW